jgi:hypothetical protein
MNREESNVSYFLHVVGRLVVGRLGEILGCIIVGLLGMIVDMVMINLGGTRKKLIDVVQRMENIDPRFDGTTWFLCQSCLCTIFYPCNHAMAFNCVFDCIDNHHLQPFSWIV